MKIRSKKTNAEATRYGRLTAPDPTEEEYEMGAKLGDPRRCPRHPSVATSSSDGMFDAPCGACEAEMEDDR